MKYTSLILFLFISLSAFTQKQSNTFEYNEQLDINIGPNSADSIWQIGIPQKTYLDSAFSLPYALMTDTINNYGTNLSSSFIIVLNQYTVYGFPFLQVEWMQKTDLEEGVDGGVIETSYDNGLTWSNVFDDPNFRPDIVGNYQWDTLHNNQAGITGTNDWQWMAICWGSNTGTLPNGFSEIYIRYTIVSDSIDTEQEGWMIDNFFVFGGIIGNTADINSSKPIAIHPNPTQSLLNINLDEVRSNNANLEVYNNAGKIMMTQNLQINGRANHTIDVQQFPTGLYFIYLKTEDELFYQKFIKQE